jgi:branched-chain amino acid transport system substrate-binding protein
MLGQRLAAGLSAAVAALTMGFSAHAQEKKIKIGVIFDLTGPLAGDGSELHVLLANLVVPRRPSEADGRARMTR